MQILLSRTQAGPSGAVKQEQESLYCVLNPVPCLNHCSDEDWDGGPEERAAEGVGDAEGGPRKVGRDVHEGGEEAGRHGTVEEESDANLGRDVLNSHKGAYAKTKYAFKSTG